MGWLQTSFWQTKLSTTDADSLIETNEYDIMGRLGFLVYLFGGSTPGSNNPYGTDMLYCRQVFFLSFKGTPP